MNRGAAYPVPAWRVTLDGQDLTERIRPRLLELRLVECRGGEADQVDLVIHDHDGRMALPRREVELRVAIGWVDGGLVDKGTFRVDEVEYRGSPDVITVRARSADLTTLMRTRRERSWHATTLGAVIRNLAGEHGLTPRVADALAAIAVPHLDQANESDVHLLTRLAKRHDAVATVKAGHLLFMPIGSGVTAGGLALPNATITRRDGDRHAWSVTDRDSYSGVRAYWHDKSGAKRKAVLAGESGNAKRLRTTYNSEQDARENAEAEWRRLQRGAARFTYQLALGRPELYPEQSVTVQGFKEGVDGTEWLIERVTHSITGSGGFTTELELEAKAAAGAAVDDDG